MLIVDGHQGLPRSLLHPLARMCEVSWVPHRQTCSSERSHCYQCLTSAVCTSPRARLYVHTVATEAEVKQRLELEANNAARAVLCSPDPPGHVCGRCSLLNALPICFVLGTAIRCLILLDCCHLTKGS